MEWVWVWEGKTWDGWVGEEDKSLDIFIGQSNGCCEEILLSR